MAPPLRNRRGRISRFIVEVQRQSAGTSTDKKFLQPRAGAGRHVARDIAAARGKFGPESPAVLPEGGVPPAGVPGAKTLPGGQLVLDPVAGPGFDAAGFGARNGASGENECGRQEKISKDRIFHGDRPVPSAHLEVRQIRMALKSNNCTSSPARKA